MDEVFDALIDLPTSEHAAYVEQACGGDAVVRAEVEELLRAHYRTGGMLDRAVSELSPLILDAADAPAIIPERIGPFRIVAPIGEGGMGVVYLGERDGEAFTQRVAIKLMRHPAPGVVRRFLEERRILASLAHPGIARLVDGGITADGLPYFAMEYVDGGVPIDQYCDTRDLSLDARIALFDDVCDAVSHAHGQLVVHRDLKPSNILVAPDGRVKLLDFGIAKLLGAVRDGHPTDLTLGSTRIMTPEVAAPEQMRGEPVSTATDVYALGVLLYRLVSRKRPYDLAERTPVDMYRIVCEEDPPPPSSRAPDTWRRRVRGDLDLIVMTALQKDPRRRYQSPAALALDLKRFQNGEVILARPDSRRYRIGKFVARHRIAVAAGGLLLLATIAAAARERVLRQRAEVAARTAAEVEQFLVQVFDVADPFGVGDADGADVSARVLLERGAVRVDSTLSNQPDVQAELRTVLGRVFMNLGLYDRATPLLQLALDQRLAADAPDAQLASNLQLLGTALAQQDKLADAERLLREAVDRRRRESGGRDVATAESLERLATLLEDGNRFAAAESLYREVLTIRRSALGDSALPVGDALNNLGLVRFRRGAFAEAESLYRRALAIDQRHLGDRHPTTAATTQNLAQTLQLLGNLPEAERYFRQSLDAKRAVLGDTHPSVTISLNNFGGFLSSRMGRVAEGEALIREAIALDRHIFGPRHSYVAEGLRNLGTVLRGKGSFAAADSAFGEALDITRQLHGERHERVASLEGHVAQLRFLQGRTDEAVRLQRISLAKYRELLGDEHLNTLAIQSNLARMLTESGHAREGESLARTAVARLDSANSAQRGVWVSAARTLGAALTNLGRVDESLPLLERVQDVARRELGEKDFRYAHAQLTLADALLAKGRTVDARPLVRAAHATLVTHRAGQPLLAAQAESAMARVTSTVDR